MSYLRDTHKRVAAVLAEGGTLTADQIAQRLGNTFDGITSCLRGMRNRREVVAIKGGPGQPYRYRLREGACN
jgi:predicted ArsR family transcriptional regulator